MGVAVVVDTADVRRRATPDGTEPPGAADTIESVRGVLEEVKPAVEADGVSWRAPNWAAIDLHLGERPDLADVLPAPVAGVDERAGGAVALLEQNALREEILDQVLGKARLESRLPALELRAQIRVLDVSRALVGVRLVPRDVRGVGDSFVGRADRDGLRGHECDVVPLAAVVAQQVRVDMRDDESHGLLARHAGCVHERHVEVVSNSQAREVVRRDALVERVVDRAAADFIGEQRRDIAPGVVKLGYGMLLSPQCFDIVCSSVL